MQDEYIVRTFVKNIYLNADEIREFCSVAEQYKNSILIAQGNITINAKSIVSYAILDFNQPMKLIIRDLQSNKELNKFEKDFSKWIVKD